MATHKILSDLDVGGEVKGTSLDINGNADVSGSLNVTGSITNAGNVVVTNGAPQLILKDSTDDDDHQIVFRNNADGDDYFIKTRDFTSAATGDGMFIGAASSDKLALVTNNTTALTLSTSQLATFAGNLVVPGDIQHSGDTNTYIGFHNADEWRVVTGGTERLEVTNSHVQINNANLDVNGAADISGALVVHNQITGTELEGTSLDMNGSADISGDLTVHGKITQAGIVDYERYGRSYTVNVNAPLPLLTSDGSALPDGGGYRVTGHISGTGTEQVAMAVFWNENGTWNINKTFEGGTSSNHVEFKLLDHGSGSVPTVTLETHTSNYNVYVYHERLALDEGTGTDNLRGYFGADSYLSWLESTNTLTVPGSAVFTGAGEFQGNIFANVSNAGGFMLTGASASGLVRNNGTGVALRTNTTDRLVINNSGNATFTGSTTVEDLMGFGTAKAPSSLAHAASTDEGIFWHTNNEYGIYRTSGNWSGPNYQQLKLKWSTGIEIDGNGTTYGKTGINFLNGNIQMDGTQILDVSRNLLNINNATFAGSVTATGGLIVDGQFTYDNDAGNQPFYITRQGSNTEALSIKVTDSVVRFESIQDETADDYGGFEFRMDSGTTEPDFVVRKGTASPILTVRGDGNTTIDGDLDLASTHKITIGPNSTWGKSLIIGNDANNSTSNAASIGTTNGNLHLDAQVGGSATYLNYYDGTAGTAFGNGASGIVAWMGPDGDLWKGSSDNNGSKYWHAGNDGAGSGLDADLLDGQQGSYYATAGSLGNYLPLAGGTMTGNLTMDDSDILFEHSDGSNYYRLGIGASANFEIYNTNYGRTDLLITQSNGNATFGGSVSIQSDNDDRFLVRSNDYTISRIISRGSSGADLDKGLFSLMSSDGTNNNVEKVRIDSAGSSWFNGGAVSFADNVTITGNLVVNGTTTTLNTTTVEVEDNILQLNTTQGSPDTATATTSGISVYRGDGVTQASLIFDDGDDTWDLTNNLKVASAVEASSYKISSTTVLQGSTNVTLGSSGGTGTISLTTHTSTPFKIENDDTISIGSDTTISGDLDVSGTLSGNFVVRSTNNANTDGANFAVDTTNKSTSEYAYEVLRSGTTVAGITTVGKITGTELEGTSLDINGNADVSGNIVASSNSSVIQTPRVSIESDGTIDWGQTRNTGTLTWDGSHAYMVGQTSRGLKFLVNQSTTALTIDTSGNADFNDGNITGVNELEFEDGFKLFGGGNNNYLKAKAANTANGGIIFQDGDSETMGYIYWDGASTANFGFLDATGTWAVRCRENEWVRLHYDNTVVLETKSGGVNINGELQADSLDINGNADISGNITGVDSITASATVQAEHLRSTDDLVVDDDASIGGDLTVTGTNYGIYHAVVDDQYYFDDYNGSRNLNIFYKNTRSDILRYRQVDNYEYWNGSAWVSDSSKLSSVKNLLDGRQDTSYSVPARDYKFRFTTSLATGWPTMAMIWMQTSWSGSTYPGATMTVEHLISGTWTTKVTAALTSANGVTNWGTAARADTALHDGNGSGTNTTRITIDFYGWTPSNSSYVTIPLQNLMITSNFSGTENTDYTNLLDYDRNATFAGELTIPSYIHHAGDSGTKFGFEGNDAFRLYTSNTMQLQIDSSGNATFAGDINVGANYVGRDSTDMVDFSNDNQISFKAANATRVTIDGSQMYPNSTNAYNLGHSNYRWNDLYFGSGSIINFNDDVTLTHSSNALTIAGGQLTVSGEIEATSLDIDGNADISGTLTLGGDVTIINSIIHAGDTDTYFGFHDTDQWRVVTGGTERFEITNSGSTFSGDVQAAGLYVGATNTSFDFYNNGTSYLNGAVTIDDTLTVTTISATNYGLASGDIPNNAADTTGNAATATLAATSTIASDTGSATHFPVFVDGSTGSRALKSHSSWNYNPGTSTLTTGKITTDTAAIVENAKSNAALMTLTGAGAGNEANISLKLAGTVHGSPIKMKLVAETTGGDPAGNGLLSYHPDTDTFGIGQTTTHNSMAMLIDNSDVVSFKNQATFTNGISVTSAVQSTSQTTGTVKIAGGVGIVKTLNVGEDVVAYASSDERYKDNLQAITNPIDKVKSLTGYTFTWNDKHEQFNGNDDIGVVAQEVEKVFPEIVDTRDNGYKAVKYEKMVAVLIEAVKEQQKQIDELKEKCNGCSK